MARLCTICDADFRIEVERHKIGVGEEMSGRVEFILAVMPYSVRKDRRDNHTEYDVLVSDDMKNIAEYGKMVTEMRKSPALQKKKER